MRHSRQPPPAIPPSPVSSPCPHSPNNSLPHLSFLHVNICGLRTKIDELRLAAADTAPHIISIQESKLPNHHRIPPIPNYTFYHLPAHTANTYVHHGLIIYVRNDLNHYPFSIVSQPENGEALGIHILPTDGPRISFLSFYQRPNRAIDRTFFRSLFRAHPRLVILGDLNASHIDWYAGRTNQLGTQLLDITLDLNLTVTIADQPTRPSYSTRAGSYIDIALTPRCLTSLISDYYTLDDIGSDHLPTLLILNVNPKLTPIVPRAPRPDFSQADWKSFDTLLTDAADDLPYLDNTRPSVDAAIDHLTTLISLTASKTIPPIHPKIYSNPLPKFILDLIRRKKRANKDALKATASHLRQYYKHQYNVLNKRIKAEIQIYRQAHYKHIWDTQTVKQPGRFYQLVKRFIKTKKSRSHSSNHSFILDGDQRIFATADKLTVFHDLYAQLYSVPSPLVSDAPDLPPDLIPSITSCPDMTEPLEFSSDISPHDITTALSKTRNTAPGRDKIFYAYLKHLPPPILSYLADIYSTCLKLAYFPPLWKKGTTILLPKPHKDHTNPQNYRPITLLPALGKTFERIINTRLQSHIESNALLPDSQSGFRPARSIQDNLLEIVQDASWNISHGFYTMAIFFDILKAFDRVWHHGLLHKMKSSLNLSPPILKLIHSFLSDRTTQLSINGSLSDPIHLRAGTPQGSVLSPLLFNMFVSDIPVPLSKQKFHTHISQFADDICCWANGRDVSTVVSRLQTITNSIIEWCNHSRISLSPLKTQLILFNRRNFRSSPAPTIRVLDQTVSPPPAVTYLGLILDSQLNFEKWHTELTTRVHSRLGQFRIITGTPKCPRAAPLLGIHIYRSMIRPLLDFSATIMILRTPRQKLRMDALQSRALKLAYHAPLYISSQFIARKALRHNIISLRTRICKLAHSYCYNPKRPASFKKFFHTARTAARRFRRLIRPRHPLPRFQKETPVSLIKEIVFTESDSTPSEPPPPSPTSRIASL